ncbi:MAG: mycofactocin biosynthesis glycosyltransferase MftF, partial [Geopsychrobacter sp.]|nr:mycofactocin biosynthesis glycosyltransferase MftF [Geopsychrobacter sp.]
MNYRLADGLKVEVSVDASFLVATRPLRMLRLNKALLTLVLRMEKGQVSSFSVAESKALESLADRGFVVRQWPDIKTMEPLPRVTVIIPVKDRAADLRNCLVSLQALDYPKDKLEVVVIDDGSSDPTPDVAREFGAQLVASGAVGGGPALARNKGAAVASGEILAFIDSDCTAAQDWLTDLLPVFFDPNVAAVGGWVDGMHHESALDRYEAVMSSLNLGSREMVGGAGGDTFYLPSCNLLMRKDAFTAAGGFRAEMQVGEDVDLTWRLRDAGWQIRYLPVGRVYHAHRSKLWPFMQRRFDYGTSEGLLQRLHPVRGKKMLLPPMLTLILLLLTTALIGQFWQPLPLAVLLLLVDSGLFHQKMRKQGLRLSASAILLARSRAVGSLGYYLGYHLLRYYLLPLLLLAGLFSPAALLLLIMVTGVGLVDHQV